ncbi:MAG: hypothetical protein IT373_09935 [Polyangiaceae bacterium]|nr:hypothetical protein [Polyangiaceae bacterium]
MRPSPFVFLLAALAAGCDADAKRCLADKTVSDDERLAACTRACNQQKNIDACEVLAALEDERGTPGSSLGALASAFRERQRPASATATAAADPRTDRPVGD